MLSYATFTLCLLLSFTCDIFTFVILKVQLLVAIQEEKYLVMAQVENLFLASNWYEPEVIANDIRHGMPTHQPHRHQENELEPLCQGCVCV